MFDPKVVMGIKRHPDCICLEKESIPNIVFPAVLATEVMTRLSGVVSAGIIS